jgi:hypothetical protein
VKPCFLHDHINEWKAGKMIERVKTEALWRLKNLTFTFLYYLRRTGASNRRIRSTKKYRFIWNSKLQLISRILSATMPAATFPTCGQTAKSSYPKFPQKRYHYLNLCTTKRLRFRNGWIKCASTKLHNTWQHKQPRLAQ